MRFALVCLFAVLPVALPAAEAAKPTPAPAATAPAFDFKTSSASLSKLVATVKEQGIKAVSGSDVAEKRKAKDAIEALYATISQFTDDAVKSGVAEEDVHRALDRTGYAALGQIKRDLTEALQGK